MRLVERGKRERRKREKLIFYFVTYMTLFCITLLFYQVYVCINEREREREKCNLFYLPSSAVHRKHFLI
jgi:hypothetical protein